MSLSSISPVPTTMTTSKKHPRESKTGGDGKPKKARNAYTFFVKEKRAAIASELPTADFCQLGKTMGERWRGLSAEEKAPFINKATIDSARFKEENSVAISMSSCNNNNSEEDLKSGGDGDRDSKQKKDRKSKQGFQLNDPKLLRQLYRKITGIFELVESNIDKDRSMIPTFEGLVPQLTSMLARIHASSIPVSLSSTSNI